jgi:hypothetical protein
MKHIFLFLILTYFFGAATAQSQITKGDEKSEAIIAKAVQRLGGDRYLQIKTIVGRGNYTPFKDGQGGALTSFVDYIAYPDNERTEFKTGGLKTVQVNTGETGWVYDGSSKTVKDQTPEAVAEWKFSLRTNLDNFLRGAWRGAGTAAKLEYAGRREAGIGRRNDVVRLTYADGLAVEFEFAADGTPAKALYQRKSADGTFFIEEDRFAQWIEVSGALVPFIIDHYRDGKQISRVNYQSIELNAPIDKQLFAKPSDKKK